MTTLKEHVNTIERLANDGLITSISIDITGVGLAFYDLLVERVGHKIDVIKVSKVGYHDNKN